MCVAASYPC